MGEVVNCCVSRLTCPVFTKVDRCQLLKDFSGYGHAFKDSSFFMVANGFLAGYRRSLGEFHGGKWLKKLFL